MIEGTALELADRLDGALRWPILIDAASTLRQQHAEIERMKSERAHVYDLLARIHRDGGQYAAEHGIEKSCDDAEAQVVTWLDTINIVDALCEQARLAEREACARIADRGTNPMPATNTDRYLQGAKEASALTASAIAKTIRARAVP